MRPGCADHMLTSSHEIDSLRYRPTIVLADDHPMVMHQVQSILSCDYEVVAIAHDGRQALQIIRQLTPDIAIMDISMPEMDGMSVARELLKNSCRTRIIFLTVYGDNDYISAAMALGAKGYVLKSRVISELRHAIEENLCGRIFISARLTAT